MAAFPPAAPPPQPNRSWWQRNWIWFVPSGCLALILLVVGFFALLAGIVFGAMKSSSAYKTAVMSAKSDPEVIQTLGTPIKEGWFVSGRTNTSGGSGDANLSIPISGPRGKATIYVVASSSGGVWSYSKLEVQVKETGKTIDLTNKIER